MPGGKQFFNNHPGRQQRYTTRHVNAAVRLRSSTPVHNPGRERRRTTSISNPGCRSRHFPTRAPLPLLRP